MDTPIAPTQANLFIDRVRDFERAHTGLPGPLPVASGGPQQDGFASMVRHALSDLNRSQVHAADLRTAYETGTTDLPLTDVVLAMQKSSLAFEATLQMRNKVLKAYDDIMSMPV